MKFILIADEGERPAAFFPLWEVILFVFVISALLCFLYPHDLLQKALAEENPSAVTLSYLKAFKTQQQENPTFMTALIEQEIGMGQFELATLDMAHLKKLQPSPDAAGIAQLEWLDYLFWRAKTYKTKINTAKRIAYLGRLREMAQHLSKAPLKPKQLKRLALETLSIGKPDIALSIYKQLMLNHQITTVNDFEAGGSIAMQNNAHRDSAAFYWDAYLSASSSSKKKEYALDAIMALWAGNYVHEALDLVQKLPEGLVNDRKTLLYFSELALAANNSELAEHYAIQALLLDKGAHDE